MASRLFHAIWQLAMTGPVVGPHITPPKLRVFSSLRVRGGDDCLKDEVGHLPLPYFPEMPEPPKQSPWDATGLVSGMAAGDCVASPCPFFFLGIRTRKIRLRGFFPHRIAARNDGPRCWASHHSAQPAAFFVIASARRRWRSGRRSRPSSAPIFSRDAGAAEAIPMGWHRGGFGGWRQEIASPARTVCP